MSTMHKVVLHQPDFARLPKRHRPSNILHSAKKLLPIEKLADVKNGGGAIVLNDGSMRQIITFEGLNIWRATDAQRDQLERDFHSFILEIDFDLQFVLQTDKYQASKYDSATEHMKQKDNAYTQWLSTYTRAWFGLAAEKFAVLERQWYVVVPTTQTGASGLRSVARNSERVLDWLSRQGAQARLLSCDEIRSLLHRRTHPSLQKDDVLHEFASSACSPAGLALPDRVVEFRNELEIDGEYVRTAHLAQLPREVFLGWLISLETVPVPCVFSVHFHRSATSSSKTSGSMVDVGFYVTTHAGTKQRLSHVSDIISAMFKDLLTLVAPPDWQYHAWLSSLPIGFDAACATNKVDSLVAATFWPLFGDHAGDDRGALLGFTTPTRSPVFLNLQSGSAGGGNVFVISPNQQERDFIAALLTLRLLPQDIRVAIWDGSGTMQRLADALGPAAAEWCPTEETMADDLVYYAPCRAPKNRGAVLARFISQHLPSRGEKPKLCVISEHFNVIQQLSTQFKRESAAITSGAQSALLLAVNTDGIRACKSLKNSLIVHPQTTEMRRAKPQSDLTKALLSWIAEKHCEERSVDSPGTLPATFIDDRSRRGARVASIRMVLAPLDHWLVQPSAEQALLKKMQAIAEQNPTFSATDRLRQAAYYLAVETGAE